MRSRSLITPFFKAEGNDGAVDKVVMDKDVKSLITFRRLNLMAPWPFHGKFDAIFCRNVMIYFDAPTKSTLVERFTQQLKPGGWLYHRPFGIADRIASRTAARRPHDLPEDGMSIALAQKQPADAASAEASQAAPGRRFFDNDAFRLDGEGVSRRVLRHAASRTRSW